MRIRYGGTAALAALLIFSVGPYASAFLPNQIRAPKRPNMTTARRAAAALALQPQVAGGALTSCGSISAAGTYTLSQDITTSSLCFDVAGASNVTINCNNHKINVSGGPAFSVYASNNVTINGCNGNSSPFDNAQSVQISQSQNITVENGQWQGGFSIANSTGVQIVDNSIAAEGTMGVFEFASLQTQITGNMVTTSGPDYEDAVIWFESGSRNVAKNNLIDGGWNQQPNGPTGYPPGADDGFCIVAESSATIMNNAISDLWDAGIEFVTGSIEGTYGPTNYNVVSANSVQNAATAVVSSYWGTNLTANQITNNYGAGINSDHLFRFERDDALSAGESALTFKNNIFRGNSVNIKTAGDVSSSFDFTTQPQNISGNHFGQNDFKATAAVPDFTPGTQAVDDGGNVCASAGAPAGFPLHCLAGPAPTITSAPTAQTTQGAPFSYRITGGGSITSYNASGLPTGVTVNSTTGMISGTPGASGRYNVMLTVTGAGGSENAPLAINVSSAPAVSTPTVTASIVVNAFGTPVSGVYPAMQLQNGSTVLATWNVTASSANYTYSNATLPFGANLKVAYSNHTTSGKLSRNLYVNSLTISSITIPSTSTVVYATGGGASCRTGYLQTNLLGCNGSFQFPTTTLVSFMAYGIPSAGVYPHVQLQQGSTPLSSYNVTGSTLTYTYFSSATLSTANLRVAYTNDVSTPQDRNLFVTQLTYNGKTTLTTSPTVYGAGVWTGKACQNGYFDTTKLNCNGYFEFPTLKPAAPPIVNLSTTTFIPNTVTATPMGSIHSVRVRPSPFRASRGDTQVIFDQLPAGATVKLFTVGGRWVKTLDASGASAAWDLTNNAGEHVASGIYLYLVQDAAGERTTGKLGVIQ